MRVLHVVPSYIPAWRYGGPIRSVHGLCRALARRGVEVHVFTTNVDGDRDSDVPLGRPVDLDGVNVWYFPSSRARRFYYAPAMKAELRRSIDRFQIVHTHSIYLWPTWVASREAERHHVPYVVSPKGMLVRELVRRKSRLVKSLWIRCIERRSLYRAAAIQVTSRQELEELERFDVGPARRILLSHGIDPPEVADGPDPLSTRSSVPGRIVFLGRVNWEKGLDRLLPAMVHVPSAELLIAGNDEEDYVSRLRQIAARFGVEDRVRFVGPVADDAKWDLLRSASLVVLPSYSENFGVAAVEAMAVGRPVAVTPEVGLAEAVRESGSGIVVDGRPDAFGPALQKLLDQPERLREMGETAHRTVREQFTWDRVAEQMERQYAELLRR